MITDLASFYRMIDELPRQQMGDITYAFGAQITKITPETIKIIVAMPSGLGDSISRQEQWLAITKARTLLLSTIRSMQLATVAPLKSIPDPIWPNPDDRGWGPGTIYPGGPGPFPQFPGPRPSPLNPGPTYIGDPPPGSGQQWQIPVGPQCADAAKLLSEVFGGDQVTVPDGIGTSLTRELFRDAGFNDGCPDALAFTSAYFNNQQFRDAVKSYTARHQTLSNDQVREIFIAAWRRLK